MVWFDIAGAHAGLALATALAAFINAGLLYYVLRKEQIFVLQAGWRGFLIKVALAALVMVLLLYFGSPPLEQWMAWGGWDRALWLFVWVMAGMASYFATLLLLGVRVKDLLGKPKNSTRPLHEK